LLGFNERGIRITAQTEFPPPSVARVEKDPMASACWRDVEIETSTIGVTSRLSELPDL
jgi:hypothetical protein